MASLSQRRLLGRLVAGPIIEQARLGRVRRDQVLQPACHKRFSNEGQVRILDLTYRGAHARSLMALMQKSSLPNLRVIDRLFWNLDRLGFGPALVRPQLEALSVSLRDVASDDLSLSRCLDLSALQDLDVNYETCTFDGQLVRFTTTVRPSLFKL